MKINNLSYSLQFAVLRAGAEAEYAHCTSPGIEYWFLGILKLSELKAKDAFRLPESELKAIDEDIEAVKGALQEYGIDSGTLRSRLRHSLKHGAKSDPDSIDKYLEPALKAAKQRGQENVWAIDLLRVLLETPTDTLRDYLPQKVKKEEKPDKADGSGGRKDEKADSSPSPAQGRDFLPPSLKRSEGSGHRSSIQFRDRTMSCMHLLKECSPQRYWPQRMRSGFVPGRSSLLSGRPESARLSSRNRLRKTSGSPISALICPLTPIISPIWDL